MAHITLRSDELRAIILGKVDWNMCPACNGHGFLILVEEGEKMNIECENCEGVGFLVPVEYTPMEVVIERV